MGTEQINHFLLVYDRQEGVQREIIEFGTDIAAALKRYQELEHAHAENPRIDIVLVGSDSIETIRITHANYFEEGVTTMQQIEEYLEGFTHHVTGR